MPDWSAGTMSLPAQRISVETGQDCQCRLARGPHPKPEGPTGLGHPSYSLHTTRVTLRCTIAL
jgi:hypothetical protein